MTKPSRSKKSQPEFDPSELEDLIFTPAVGSGVGSHLLTTVDRSEVTSVEHTLQITENQQHLDVPTVADTTTAAKFDMTTVVRLPPIWTTEDGQFVPGSRVRRIRLAQDVLNSAEESVYDVLWSAKTAVRDELDSTRIVQAGYDYLMKRTRVSKKTIQRIIDRLIEKGFIAIERPADIYQRSATVYRVFSYRVVLERQAIQGRFYVVKIGPGLLYAHPPSDTTTEGDSQSATVDTTHPASVVKATPVTVGSDSQTTVVPATTIKIEQKSIGQVEASSSPEVRALRERVEKLIGPVDTDAVRKLWAQCRGRAGDCTVEEVAYFVEYKLRWVRNIQNPVGFILTAVPRHFENGGHLSVRETLRQEAEARREEWRQTYDYWKRLADDATQPEEERAEARKILASLLDYFQP